MKNESSNSRRDFIKLAAASALTSTLRRNTAAAAKTEFILPASSPALSSKVAPSDKIRLATIGAGGQGSYDTGVAVKIPGVELVAVADIYDGRLLRAKEVYGNQLFTTRDYREVLARPDIDAVIVGTPDHWHMQVSADAMAAGKDVYCEKPMVRSVREGHQLIETQNKTRRIFQVGSQRVSSIVYRKAKELLAAGAIGELNLVEAWWDRNSAIGAWQYSIPPDASPATIDWDRFLGSAPKRPFEPIRLFRWRNYRDYGTGVAGDLFVHLFSGLHYIAGANGPSRVMTTGGLRYWRDGRDVPDVMLGIYDYPQTERMPAFNLTLKVDFADGSGESSGFRFVGSEGVMTIGSTLTLSRKPKPKEPGYTIGTFPKAVQDEFLKQYREKYPPAQPELSPTSEETYMPPSGYSDSADHFANFFDAVRTRKPVVEDAVFGLRAAGPALLSNLSYFESRVHTWDPEALTMKTEPKS